jgi:LPXTG-motif cell wall-anchored protein
MSKRAVSLAAAAMLCMGLSVALAGTAAAQNGPPLLQPTGPGYPPSTTTTIINPTFASQTQTTVINGHFTVEECGFYPGSQADYSYSGGQTGVLVVDSNGCIAITVYAYDPHVTINGGPLVPAKYQGNTIVVVGTGANTAQRTYTLTFNIVQPSSPPPASGSGTTSGSAGSANNTASNTSSTPSSTSSSSGSGSSGSGSGSGSSSDPSGTLAFTGSNTAATLLAGLLLLVAGGLLVLFTRRRSQRRAD